MVFRLLNGYGLGFKCLGFVMVFCWNRVLEIFVGLGIEFFIVGSGRDLGGFRGEDVWYGDVRVFRVMVGIIYFAIICVCFWDVKVGIRICLLLFFLYLVVFGT